MAIPRRFLLLLISLFVSAAAATDSDISLSPPLNAPPTHAYPPGIFATVLSSLGFQELSTAVAAANLSATTTLTIFAPTDASLLSCSSCSLPLLLRELSIPGLYPLHFLQTLTSGTKIETLAPNRCLTITGNEKENTVFVDGIRIATPDVFNNGLVVVHGIKGFVSHLSPHSCNVDQMTSLSFPPSAATSTVPPSLIVMRFMLKDAIARLRATGHNVVSLALRDKFLELAGLKSLTVFAIDDTAIFSGGGNNAYLSSFRYHVVPNKRLTAAELTSLPPTTSLPTMDAGNSLVVTTSGGGGPLAPMRINFVKITTIDLLHNTRIVVHGISSPFPHMRNHPAYTADIQRPTCDHYDWSRGVCVDVDGAEAPATLKSTVGVDVGDDDHDRFDELY